jgi:predicted deacylase
MQEIQHQIDGDTPGQGYTLRVLEFAGSGKAPRIYMQAALHSWEMPGVVALDVLIPLIKAAGEEGRVRSQITIVPFANPIGLAQTVFGVPMGRFDLNGRINFNREFPVTAKPAAPETTAVKRLKALLLGMAEQSDVMLDLHCDDEGVLYLYTSTDMEDPAHLLSAALGAEVILTDDEDAAASFEGAVYTRWKAATGAVDAGAKFCSTVEFRGKGDVSPETAARDGKGLYDYLVAIGAIEDEPRTFAPNTPLIAHQSRAEYIYAPAGGAVLYDVALGEMVTKGQCVARIISAPGGEPHRLCAPYDGYVMVGRERRILRRGDEVIKILPMTA